MFKVIASGCVLVGLLAGAGAAALALKPTTGERVLGMSVEAITPMSEVQAPRGQAGAATRVGANDDLAAAVKRAAPGTRLLLPAGAVYPALTIARSDITIETDADAGDERATAELASRLATITGNGAYAIDIAPAVSNVTLRKLHIIGVSNDLINCGRGDASQATRDQQPRNVTLDQLVVNGEAGAKRGVTANCANLVVSRSDISVRRKGQDSAAIGGWNGEGPFRFDNNRLNGASYDVIFGGAGPRIPELIPSDITVTNNTLTTTPEWRGGGFGVKNAFELKVGRRVVVRGNTIENVWSEGQTGYCIVLTPENQDNNLPETVIADVLIEQNVIRNCGSGINILGRGQHHPTKPTEVTTDVTIRDNFFLLDGKTYGGHGHFMQVGNGPRNLVIDHNTIDMRTGNQYIMGAASALEPMTGFRFTGNLGVRSGSYGLVVYLANKQSGFNGRRWRDYFGADAEFAGNMFGAWPTPSQMPAGNRNVPAATPIVVDANGYGKAAAAGYGRRR